MTIKESQKLLKSNFWKKLKPEYVEKFKNALKNAYQTKRVAI